MSAIRLQSGSTPWLLAHELRLSLRAVTGRRGGRLTLIVVAVALAFGTVVGGVPMALAIRTVPVRPTPLLILIFDLAMGAIFTLILSQTLASATTAFYERGDLDLLLSSPVPPAAS